VIRIDSPGGRTRAGGELLRALAIGSILVARTAAAGAETQERVDRVIPPGQEELLAEMLGRGMALPGGCRFDGADADGAIVTARYACDAGRAVIELRPPGDAPTALRTQQFTIVVRGRSVPAGLSEAVAELIRAREARLEWTTATRLPVAPFGLVLGGSAIVAITLLMQYLIGSSPGRRLGSRRAQSVALLRTVHGWREQAFTARGLAALGLVSAYLGTRLWDLTRLPVFVDESIHIEWARGSLGHYFIPEVSVGKWLPLQFMTVAMFLPLHPLACARLPSVAMGLATLVACVLINAELFALGEGLLAGAVYAILPFALLYDRLALADIYLTACGAWSVYAALMTMRSGGRVAPMAMSLFTFAAIFSKPTGGLFLAVPLLVSLLLVPRGGGRVYLGRCLPTLIGGAALLLFLLNGGYGTNLLASQSGFGGLPRFVTNLETSREWLTALLTPGAAWATVAAALWSLLGVFRRRNSDAFLGVLLLFAVIPYALVSNVWFPRYLLFITVPVSLLLARTIAACAAGIVRAAEGLSASWPIPSTRTLSIGMIVAFALIAAPRDLALMTEPEAAALPAAERTQYISGWTSGYGLPELTAFLHEQAREGPLNIVRFASSGPANQGLDVYLHGAGSMQMFSIDPRVGGEDVWPWPSESLIEKLTARRRTLFISNPEGDAPEERPATSQLRRGERIWTYARPGAESRLDVWEVPHPQEPP
jgi:hypothetical protein